MKRFIICLCTVLLLTIHVFAYYSPNLTYEDGNNVLGTFLTSAITDENKSAVREWLDSDLSLIVYVPSSQRYLLLIANTADNLIINRSSDGLAVLYLSGGATGTVWDVEGDNLEFAAMTSINSTPILSDCVIIGGRYFSTCDVSFPTPIDTYTADITGSSLFLRDDGGLMSDTEIDNEDEDSGGILGFLSDFWDKLKDFFIGLFVPEDGYFQKWYQSLKAAVDEKLSGVSSLYNGLTSFFDSLSGSSETIRFEIPANHFFTGSPAISADIFENLSSVISFIRGVLTGAVVLFTAIICYRKLVTIFRE